MDKMTRVEAYHENFKEIKEEKTIEHTTNNNFKERMNAYYSARKLIKQIVK